MKELPSRALAALLSMALLLAGCAQEESEAPASTRATAPAEDAPAESLGGAPMPSDLEQGLLRGIGLQWQRIKNAPGRTGILAEKPRYSLFLEEVIIRDFFQDRRGGFFVDVGCAWPIQSNNTYYLEKHLGWTGIGIDALEDYAEGWKEKRPGSKFFSFLVTDRTTDRATFFKSAGLGLSSVDPEAASGVQFGARAAPEEIQVPAITLDDLLDREGVAKIDLLAMDIEGHEATALAGFDIDRFRPELVVVEGEDPVVTRYLTAHGYQRVKRYVPYDPVNRYFSPKRNEATASGAALGR